MILVQKGLIYHPVKKSTVDKEMHTQLGLATRVHMAILILVVITLNTATVCCVADWGGDLSLIASTLPTGW